MPVTSDLVACSAGTTPKAMPVATADASRNRNAVQSRPISNARGIWDAASVASTLVTATATNTAATLAASASTTAFGQELPEEAAASRAEGRAHRHFPLPPLGAHQQQIGHVGARDQQDHRDSAEQSQHARSRAADNRLGQRDHLHASVRVRSRQRRETRRRWRAAPRPRRRSSRPASRVRPRHQCAEDQLSVRGNSAGIQTSVIVARYGNWNESGMTPMTV